MAAFVVGIRKDNIRNTNFCPRNVPGDLPNNKERKIFFETEISELLNKIFYLSMRELTTCKIYSYFVTTLGTSGSTETHRGQKKVLVKGDEVDWRIVCVQGVQLIIPTFRHAWFRSNCNGR
jgi:hypothetical protein